MITILRKPFLWRVLDARYHRELEQGKRYQLKNAQDLAIYENLRDCCNLRIAEVGGGNSRILPRLANKNECYNIDKFDGSSGGPFSPPDQSGINYITAYLGEFSELVPSNSFDRLFSVSVVEHIAHNNLKEFFEDTIRVLKKGAIFYHAVDIYLSNEVSSAVNHRVSLYSKWFDDPRVIPLGEVETGPFVFKTDMVSNPDNIMHIWGKKVPELAERRVCTQCVSLLIGGRKRSD